MNDPSQLKCSLFSASSASGGSPRGGRSWVGTAGHGLRSGLCRRRHFLPRSLGFPSDACRSCGPRMRGGWGDPPGPGPCYNKLQFMQKKMFISLWQYLYRHFFRFWVKWLIRVFTRKCELQRICEGFVGGERTYKIENALVLSKNQVLQNATFVNHNKVEDCIEDIMKEKNINPKNDKRFKIRMKTCLLQISGYKQLCLDVENVRKSPYDSDNQHHEELLLKLWNLLMPNEKLKARITKQWIDIGFQGDDPKTDFRGMGLLGLINLVYFSENYTKYSHRILNHSNHPTLGYFYAIVGINLTEMAYSLLKSNALKFHFYNSVPGIPTMEHFHQFYCYLFYEFDKFWFEEEPESIMYFNQYREKFHEKIKNLLLDYRVILTLKI